MFVIGGKARQSSTTATFSGSKHQKLDIPATRTTRTTKPSVITNRTSNNYSSRTAPLKASIAVHNAKVAKSKFTGGESIATNAVPLVRNRIKASRSSIPIIPKEKALKSAEKPLLVADVRSKPLLSQPYTSTSYTIGTRRKFSKTNNASLKSSSNTKNTCNDFKMPENLHQGLQAIEIGIQTQEEEILNHSLLVGDIKFVKPSQSVVDEIEKLRKDLKNKRLLQTPRKFEKHSERQEEHLNDLREFLEKSHVPKRRRKSRYTYEEDRHAMDQLFSREIPNTESIKDIKARIALKEQELLKLFDSVEGTARLLSNKPNN